MVCVPEAVPAAALDQHHPSLSVNVTCRVRKLGPVPKATSADPSLYAAVPNALPHACLTGSYAYTRVLAYPKMEFPAKVPPSRATLSTA